MNNKSDRNFIRKGEFTGMESDLDFNYQPPMDECDPLIKELLINYNHRAREGKFSRALFRDIQIYQILSILNTKKHPNALIVGNSGVGKTQIVEEIANRLVEGEAISCGMLKNVTIYELPVAKIISGSTYIGDVEEKLYKVMDFIENPANNAILFIDEIHQITDPGRGAYGKIVQILKPVLARGRVRVIGATTTQEANSFMNDPAFSRRWSRINVPEFTREQTIAILEKIKDGYEKHHNVRMNNSLLKDLVRLADEYGEYGSHRPDNAITFMDKLMSNTKLKRLRLIEKAKNDTSLKEYLDMNPEETVTYEQMVNSASTLIVGSKKFLNQDIDEIERELSQVIIGQDKAKKALMDYIKRMKLGLINRDSPISFLFSGASGVGKTEIAKQLASIVFGSKNNLININMSEYSHYSSLTRITGSPTGYKGSDLNHELPFDSLENNPYQIILLDELEKADINVQRFFLKALDEGKVMTNRNKDINFSKSIIIATTNAGNIEFNKRSIGFGNDNTNSLNINKAIDMLKDSFDIELLNRFDEIINFENISKKEYREILAVKYNQIVGEIRKNSRGILIEPVEINIFDQSLHDNKILRALADESYVPKLGGRPAGKIMRKYIEDRILKNPEKKEINML